MLHLKEFFTKWCNSAYLDNQQTPDQTYSTFIVFFLFYILKNINNLDPQHNLKQGELNKIWAFASQT